MKNGVLGILVVLFVAFPGMGFGTSLQVTWNPNPESDLKGYEIAHGMLLPGVYTEYLEAGNNTEYIMENVLSGVYHYVSVRAYNKRGEYSEFSNEVSIYAPWILYEQAEHGKP